MRLGCESLIESMGFVNKQPGYYGLIEFVVEKEEILTERQQCKESSHLTPHSTSILWKPNWSTQKPMTLARMVAPAPEEDDYPPSAEQLGREDGNSGESYAVNDEPAPQWRMESVKSTYKSFSESLVSQKI